MPTANIGTLMAHLGVDTKDLKRAERDVKTSTDKMQVSFKAVGTAIVAAFSISAISEFARELVTTADKMTLLTARVKLVTNSQKELLFVQNRLFEIAQETRQSFASVTEVYARLGRSARETGASSNELLQVMENLNKAILVSGATSTESSAALTQLSQGLASNRLGGEELRSVMEQIPRVARAIADGLGVSIGKFRELAFEGKLTAETVIDALLSQTDTLNQEFEGMPITVEQSISKVRNVMDLLISDINNATGATETLSGAISSFADFVNDPVMKSGLSKFISFLIEVEEYAFKSATYILKIAAAIQFISAKLGLGLLKEGIKSSGTEEETQAPPNAQFPESIRMMKTFEFSERQLDKMRNVAEKRKKIIRDMETDALKTMLGPDDLEVQTPEYLGYFLAENIRIAQEIKDSWISAFNTIETQFAATFSLAMKGDFDGILDSWINMLNQMVVKWAAAQAMIALFGEDYNSGGKGDSGILGDVGTAIGKIFGGQATTNNASGGMITEPIIGLGTSTGRRYKFGENGAEMVTPVNALQQENNQTGSSASSPVINIFAADAPSFIEFSKRNPQAFISPIVDGIRQGNRELRLAIQGAAS